MNSIIHTEPSISMLILRLGLALTFFLHSSQQIRGRGLMGTIRNWKERYKIPVIIGIIGFSTEFLGAFALLIGFVARPAALMLSLFILIVIKKAHAPWEHGFFLARGQGENGVEYTLALLLMALAILFDGAGTLSVDLLLS